MAPEVVACQEDLAVVLEARVVPFPVEEMDLVAAAFSFDNSPVSGMVRLSLHRQATVKESVLVLYLEALLLARNEQDYVATAGRSDDASTQSLIGEVAPLLRQRLPGVTLPAANALSLCQT
jgi:hypothetical protein